MSAAPVRLAVIGAGLIGIRHAALISKHTCIELAGVADPMAENRSKAEHFGCPVAENIEALLAQCGPCSGVIIATPNNTHLALGETCLKLGLPILMEKPLAADSKDAQALVELSRKKKIPILVGHHRRHHKQAKALRQIIEQEKLGKIIAAQVTWCLSKPDSYFEQGQWRKASGGGPVWINLIHEIDMLRFVLGEIAEVSAMLGTIGRGAEVEDTAAITFRFTNGILANVILSDATPSPWHFEGASGENPNIQETGQDGMRIFGTNASVSFPSLSIWQHEDQTDGGWGDPIILSTPDETTPMGNETALHTQLEHFAQVCRGEVEPLVNARDGLGNIRVIEAIHQSEQSGSTVRLSRNCQE